MMIVFELVAIMLVGFALGFIACWLVVWHYVLEPILEEGK